MKAENSFENALSDIGYRLEILRIKKGFPTSKDFAEHYDLPMIQYWRMEKGKANITLKSLLKILAIHKITLEDFFCLSVTNTAAA
jgi:hypothetical protein